MLRPTCILVTTITILMLIVCTHASAGEDYLLDGFEYPSDVSARSSWKGTGRVSVHRRIKTSGKTALELDCTFSAARERRFWDRNLSRPIDLSSYPYISIDVYCEGKTVGYRSIYFGVADRKDPRKRVGFYAYMIRFSMKKGWNRFLMRKEDFVTEGKVPADGWKRVNSIRISFWSLKKGKTQIIVDNLYASKIPRKSKVDLNVSADFVKQTQMRLLPQPQEANYTTESYAVSDHPAKVYATSDESTGRVWAVAGEEIAKLLGVKAPNLIELECRKKCIAFGSKEKITNILESVSKRDLRREGYFLKVTRDAVVLVADDERGLFYGANTLRQLFDQQKGVIPGAEINDWPSLGMRGIYVHRIGKGQEALQKTRQLLKTLARMKYNTVFIDVAATMKYKSRPFPVSGAQAYSQQEMRDLAAYARKHYIDLCPYYQMFMHVNWIAAEPRYRNLLEIPSQLNWDSSWCPSNPETYRFASDILNEAIDVFEPKYIHIGHDEMEFSGLGTCDRCKRRSKEDLIAESMRKTHEILARRGVKTLVWGDTLVPQFVGRGKFDLDYSRIWSQLPKDMIVSSWYYGDKLGSLHKYVHPLTSQGFKATVSPFENDRGIIVSAKYAKKQNLLGGIETLWHTWGVCGSLPDTVSNKTYALIGMTANYFWNPDCKEILLDNYDWVYRVRKEFEPGSGFPKKSKEKDWHPVDISDKANLRFTDAESVKQLFADDSMGIPDAAMTDTGVKVPFAESAIVLRSDRREKEYPESVRIAVEKSAESVMFVHALTEPYDVKHWSKVSKCTHKPVVGRYVVRWEDGSEQAIELKYRWNISTWNARAGIYQGRMIWQGKTQEGYLARLWATEWSNPKPGVKIKEIVFASSCVDGMNPVLFSLMLKKDK